MKTASPFRSPSSARKGRGGAAGGLDTQGQGPGDGGSVTDVYQGIPHDGTKEETLAFEAKPVSLSVCTNPPPGGTGKNPQAFGTSGFLGRRCQVPQMLRYDFNVQKP